MRILRDFVRLLWALAFVLGGCMAEGASDGAGQGGERAQGEQKPTAKKGKVILLLGPPGSGKGVISEELEAKGFRPIGMGNLLRAHKSKVATPDGKTVGDIMKEGGLVPHGIAIDLVNEEFEKIKSAGHGDVLVEGLRSLEQVEALDAEVKKFGGRVDAVLHLVVSEKTATNRVKHRSSCKKCGKIYGGGKRAKACERCGCKEFERRADDVNVKSLEHRFSVFNESTKSIIEHYREMGVLCEIDAEQSIDDVRKQVKEKLENLDNEGEKQ